MIRDILNWQGQVIGQLELPDNTEESVWQERLAAFAKPPPTSEQLLFLQIERAVSESRNISDKIIELFKKENLAFFILNNIPNDLALMMSLHTHHRLRTVEINISGTPFVIDLLNLVVSGDLETALMVLSQMTPDDMSQPYHFLNQERINRLIEMIRERI